MSEKVEIEMSAKDQQVVKTLQGVERAMTKLEAKVAAVGKQGKMAGQEMASGFQMAVGEMGRFAAGITGVGSVLGGVLAVVAQLRREYENLKSQQREAADKQIEFAPALKQTIRNAAGLLGGDEVEKITRDLAEKTGSSPVKAAQAFGGALSARGPTNRAQALEALAATEAALKFAKELPGEAITQLAGSAIDLTKGSKEKVSPEASIGVLQNIGGLARVVDLPSLVENIAPAAVNLNRAGVPIESAGSVVAALTQSSADFTGRTSRTASIQLQRQIAERFPNQSFDDVIGRLQGDEKLRRKFFEGGSGKEFDNGQVFADDPKRRREFLKNKFPGASFEAKEFGAVSDLLTGGSPTAAAFAEGKKKLGGFKEGQATFNELTASFKRNETLLTAELNEIVTGATEELQLFDTKGGRTAVLRDGMQKLLKASGASQTDQDLEELGFQANSGFFGHLLGFEPQDRASVDTVARGLRKRAKRLQEPQRVAPLVEGGETLEAPATPRDVAIGKKLESVANRLEEANAEQLKRIAGGIDKLVEGQKAPQKTVDVTPQPQVPIKPLAAGLSR